MTDSTTASEPIPVRIETREPTEDELQFIAGEVVKVVGLTMDLAMSRLALEGDMHVRSATWHKIRRSIMLAAADQLRAEAERPPTPKGGGLTD